MAYSVTRCFFYKRCTMKTIKGGAFIVLSGPEGAGKTTQARLLGEWLKKEDYDVLVTKEPGGGDEVSVAIRGIVTCKAFDVDSLTEFFLFCADRRQHLVKLVLPALDRGTIVICDRYIPDTFAYQSYAGKAIEVHDFRFIMDRATKGMHVPELTFWFDLPVEEGLLRKKVQMETTRFEEKQLDYHRDVAEGFRKFFSERPEYSAVPINALLSQEEVLGLLKEKLESRILRRK
jgi:dTMP kinase